MEKGKHTLVFPCKYLKTIFFQSGPRPAPTGSMGRKTYFGTDMSLNIADGLNTEVLRGSRIDPEAKLILKHKYARKTANLTDPKLDKTHRLLEKTHSNWDWSAKKIVTLTQLFIMSMNVTLRFYIFNWLCSPFKKEKKSAGVCGN